MVQGGETVGLIRRVEDTVEQGVPAAYSQQDVVDDLVVFAEFPDGSYAPFKYRVGVDLHLANAGIGPTISPDAFKTLTYVGHVRQFYEEQYNSKVGLGLDLGDYDGHFDFVEERVDPEKDDYVGNYFIVNERKNKDGEDPENSEGKASLRYDLKDLTKFFADNHVPARFGQGAQAEAVVINGSVRHVRILDGGSGYIAPTTVRIRDTGSDYQKNAQGSGAAAEAIVNDGCIVGYTVVTAGQNFVNPTVRITSPTGVGAEATCSVNALGQITGVAVKRDVFDIANQRTFELPTVITRFEYRTMDERYAESLSTMYVQVTEDSGGDPSTWNWVAPKTTSEQEDVHEIGFPHHTDANKVLATLFFESIGRDEIRKKELVLSSAVKYIRFINNGDDGAKIASIQCFPAGAPENYVTLLDDALETTDDRHGSSATTIYHNPVRTYAVTIPAPTTLKPHVDLLLHVMHTETDTLLPPSAHLYEDGAWVDKGFMADTEVREGSEIVVGYYSDASQLKVVNNGKYLPFDGKFFTHGAMTPESVPLDTDPNFYDARIFSMGVAPVIGTWSTELYYQMKLEGETTAVDGIITAGANRTWFSKFTLYQSADLAAGGDYAHSSWFQVIGPNSDGTFPANTDSSGWVTNALNNVQSAVYILLVIKKEDVTGMDLSGIGEGQESNAQDAAAQTIAFRVALQSLDATFSGRVFCEGDELTGTTSIDVDAVNVRVANGAYIVDQYNSGGLVDEATLDVKRGVATINFKGFGLTLNETPGVVEKLYLYHGLDASVQANNALLPPLLSASAQYITSVDTYTGTFQCTREFGESLLIDLPRPAYADASKIYGDPLVAEKLTLWEKEVYDTPFFGAGYTAANTTVEIVDDFGSGAIVTPIIANGVITGTKNLVGGQNYGEDTSGGTAKAMDGMDEQTIFVGSSREQKYADFSAWNDTTTGQTLDSARHVDVTFECSGEGKLPEGAVDKVRGFLVTACVMTRDQERIKDSVPDASRKDRGFVAFVEDLDDLDLNFAGMPTMADVPDLFVQLWDGYQLGTERYHIRLLLNPAPTMTVPDSTAFFDRLRFDTVPMEDRMIVTGSNLHHRRFNTVESRSEGFPPADLSFSTYAIADSAEAKLRFAHPVSSAGNDRVVSLHKVELYDGTTGNLVKTLGFSAAGDAVITGAGPMAITTSGWNGVESFAGLHVATSTQTTTQIVPEVVITDLDAANTYSARVYRHYPAANPLGSALFTRSVATEAGSTTATVTYDSANRYATEDIHEAMRVVESGSISADTYVVSSTTNTITLSAAATATGTATVAFHETRTSPCTVTLQLRTEDLMRNRSPYLFVSDWVPVSTYGGWTSLGLAMDGTTQSASVVLEVFNFAANSTEVYTNASTGSIFVGQSVTHPNIPAGTFVTEVGTWLTLGEIKLSNTTTGLIDGNVTFGEFKFHATGYLGEKINVQTGVVSATEVDNTVALVVDDDPFGGTSAIWTMTNRKFNRAAITYNREEWGDMHFGVGWENDAAALHASLFGTFSGEAFATGSQKANFVRFDFSFNNGVYTLTDWVAVAYVFDSGTEYDFYYAKMGTAEVRKYRWDESNVFDFYFNRYNWDGATVQSGLYTFAQGQPSTTCTLGWRPPDCFLEALLTTSRMRRWRKPRYCSTTRVIITTWPGGTHRPSCSTQ